jgi:hypothetical protein
LAAVGNKLVCLCIHTSFDTHLLTTGYETVESKLIWRVSVDGRQREWQNDTPNTKLTNEPSPHTKQLPHWTDFRLRRTKATSVPEANQLTLAGRID